MTQLKQTDIKKVFLIQSSNYDFCYEYKELCAFQNWYLNKKSYVYLEVDRLPDRAELVNQLMGIAAKYVTLDMIIPIGSVEFVKLFYNTYHGISDIKAINIPKELLQYKFLQRDVYEYNNGRKTFTSALLTGTEIDVNSKAEYFIKEKKIKGLVTVGKISDIIPEQNYADFTVSECVDFTSEYRCFVLKGNLLDCRCYSGDFRILPDFVLIEEMIKEYGSKNEAYTLDVGLISGGKTALIECHDFFSCGLYGFNDYNSLLKMSILTHLKILSSQNEAPSTIHSKGD